MANCTAASLRMVGGIEPMPLTISEKTCDQPPFSRFARSKASMSAGGYSRVVTTV